MLARQWVRLVTATLPRAENYSSFKTRLAFIICYKLGPTMMDMKEKTIMMALIGEGMSNIEIGRRFGRWKCAARCVKKAPAVLGNGTPPEKKRATGRNKKTQS